MIDFNRFVRAYGKGAALLFASAVVSYFLTYHSTLSPPLKPRQAIYGMSVLVEAYGILAGIDAAKTRKPPLSTMITLIIIYFLSLFSLTFLVPTSDSSYREAIGILCRKDFLDLYNVSCYWIPTNILANASFESERIWEIWSIQIVRIYLSGVWLAMVWSIVISIALSLRRTTFKQRAARQK